MRCCFCRRRPKDEDDDEGHVANNVLSNQCADRDDEADRQAVMYMRNKLIKKAEDTVTDVGGKDGEKKMSSERYVIHSNAASDALSDECESTSISVEEEMSDGLEGVKVLPGENGSVASTYGDDENKRNEVAVAGGDDPKPDSFSNEFESDESRNASDGDLSEHVRSNVDLDGEELVQAPTADKENLDSQDRGRPLQCNTNKTALDQPVCNKSPSDANFLQGSKVQESSTQTNENHADVLDQCLMAKVGSSIHEKSSSTLALSSESVAEETDSEKSYKDDIGDFQDKDGLLQSNTEEIAVDQPVCNKSPSDTNFLQGSKVQESTTHTNENHTDALDQMAKFGSSVHEMSMSTLALSSESVAEESDSEKSCEDDIGDSQDKCGLLQSNTKEIAANQPVCIKSPSGANICQGSKVQESSEKHNTNEDNTDAPDHFLLPNIGNSIHEKSGSTLALVPDSDAGESDSEKPCNDVADDYGFDRVNSERYDKARRLLHQTLVLREQSLTSSERNFLINLVNSVSAASASDDETISDIESASDSLQSNPLFQTDLQPEETEEDAGDSVKVDGKPKLHPNSIASRRGRFKKNRVELSVSDSNEIEVSQLRHPSGSVRSSASSLRTVNERAAAANETSISFRSGESTGPDTEKEDPQAKTTHDVSSTCDTEQPNKKQRVLDHEPCQIIRFDGWAVSEQESRLLADDDSESHPFLILGTSPNDESAIPHVLSPLVMEAMRGFLPYVVSEENFWMKYSFVRDGASLHTLLEKVRASIWTIIAVETVEGDVFGSFTGAPWRKQPGYFGSGEAFLWRLKKSRWAPQSHLIAMATSWIDSEMEIYPQTGQDSLLQLCTADCIAIGGGPWKFGEAPYNRSQLGVGLRIDSDLLVGESKSSGTFANPPLCRSCEDGSSFDVMNLEVWTFTPCSTTEEAEKLELRKLFIEENKRSCF